MKKVTSIEDKKKGKEIIVNARVTIGAYGSAPGCINDGVVERIIEPPEGGIFTKFVGCSYLFKGICDQKILDILAFPKRKFRNIVQFATSKIGKVIVVLLFPFKKYVVIILFEQYLKDVYVSSFTKYLNVSPNRYCVSVKEFWRVVTLFIGQVKNTRLQSILFKLRNIACMVLQNDMAYRFSLQDILPEINIEELKRNPAQELRRVFDIFCERMEDDRWRGIGRATILLLRISPAFKRLIIDFLLEIDMDKVKLDDADYYFCLQRPSYKFKGVPLEERILLKKQIDNQKGHFIPTVDILKIRR